MEKIKITQPYKASRKDVKDVIASSGVEINPNF